MHARLLTQSGCFRAANKVLAAYSIRVESRVYWYDFEGGRRQTQLRQ